MKDRPQMFVAGGPNGAGKTTFVIRAIAERGFPYIGADQIAAGISPANPESAAILAAREFIEQVNWMIETHQSFIVETTLSGKSFANMIRAAKTAGFYIALQMVFVDSPSINLDRIKNRVRQGGHHVPDGWYERWGITPPQ